MVSIKDLEIRCFIHALVSLQYYNTFKRVMWYFGNSFLYSYCDTMWIQGTLIQWFRSCPQHYKKVERQRKHPKPLLLVGLLLIMKFRIWVFLTKCKNPHMHAIYRITVYIWSRNHRYIMSYFALCWYLRYLVPDCAKGKLVQTIIRSLSPVHLAPLVEKEYAGRSHGHSA